MAVIVILVAPVIVRVVVIVIVTVIVVVKVIGMTTINENTSNRHVIVDGPHQEATVQSNRLPTFRQ